MIRKSTTEWKGDGPTGSGSLSTEERCSQRAAVFFQDALPG